MPPTEHDVEQALDLVDGPTLTVAADIAEHLRQTIEVMQDFIAATEADMVRLEKKIDAALEQAELDRQELQRVREAADERDRQYRRLMRGRQTEQPF